jgi:hypothetical protein
VHRQRIAILLIAAVGTAGTFLPWMTIAGASVGSPGNDGWITLGLFAAAAVTALAGDRRSSWRGGGFIAVAVPALLASAVGVYHFANLALRRPAPGEINLLALASPGVGLYLVTAAGIVLVAAAFALQGPAPRRVARAVPAWDSTS